MIALKAVPATIGAKGFDSYAPVNDSILQAAWADGCRFVVRYVHNITVSEIACIIKNGFAFMLVTYANRFDGADALNTSKSVGYPQGATLWLDVESVTVAVENLIAAINGWCKPVRTYFDPGIYLGCQQLMTWQEQTQLACDRYWEATSLVIDRKGNPARPATNWNMTQVGANLHLYGSVVDLDFIRQDSRGRLPMWAVAA